MFSSKTAFIVGAGASAEYGLPVGVQLADRISRMLSGRDEESKYLCDQLEFHYAPEEYEAGFAQISRGVLYSNSIDDFLDIHRNNKTINRVGKIAIVSSILDAERESKLLLDSKESLLNVGGLEETWLIKFVRMLGRGIETDRIETIFDNTTFIVFNYDRCIEHTIYHALQQLYAVPPSRAANLLGRLNIIHPYGDVGPLWTPKNGGIPFGGNSDPDVRDLVKLSQRILTYTEVKANESKENVDIALQDAEKWVFLGFAFHDQNMKLLQPGTGYDQKKIYGTAYGMSPSDLEITRRKLVQFFLGAHHYRLQEELKETLQANLTCSQLFDYFRLSLPA